MAKKGRGARRKTARKRRRHPAKMKRLQELEHLQPDATEQVVQATNRRMRQAMQDGELEDGLVKGPLTVAAEHMVHQLMRIHGFEGEEDEAAITAYLEGIWGELAHAFPEKPDVPSYPEWRERSHKHALEAAVAASNGDSHD